MNTVSVGALMNAVNTAGDAIQYVLIQIRDNSAVGYYLGEFTETFSKLVKAHREITYLGMDIPTVDKVSLEGFREMWRPRRPENPAELAERADLELAPVTGCCPCCGLDPNETDDLRDAVRDLDPNETDDLRDAVRDLVAIYATDALPCPLRMADDAKLIGVLREKLERKAK